jgi:arthrofactin-type cyclic lipopeptide synthetase B
VTREFEAPSGAIETMVAAVWAEVLQREAIGRHDDFFELGGHSLLAVHMLARLCQVGLDVDMVALFTTPTVAGLAATIAAAAEG